VLLVVGAAGLAFADGARLYAQHCAACHQPEGQGVPGLYPRLTSRLGRYLRVDGGRAYLIHVPSFGMSGAIPEDQIVNAFMPPVTQLGNEEIAHILNHLLTGLPQDALPEPHVPITSDEVAEARKTPLSPIQVHKEREGLVAALKPSSAPPGSPAPGGTARATMPRITGAIEDYSRNCQGCHLADGRGIPGLVPNMLNFVGYFTHLPEGRAFLVRVPGVAQAPLDDTRVAAILNWMLKAMSRDQLPKDFLPYTAEEVRTYRAGILTNVTSERAALIAKLRDRGVLK
jgi:mono/diheme cytochrome c family protein